MASSGWRVTAQLTDQVENTNAGQTVIGVRVYFETGAGNEGSVFVPNSHYTAKRVRELVHSHANQIDEIGGLTEGLG
jgi:hypothetical protein